MTNSFEIPIDEIDLRNKMMDTQRLIEGKNPLFYSGEGNLDKAEDCADLFPDDYYHIGQTLTCPQ